MGSQAKHQGMLRSLLVLALSAFAISFGRTHYANGLSYILLPRNQQAGTGRTQSPNEGPLGMRVMKKEGLGLRVMLENEAKAKQTVNDDIGIRLMKKEDSNLGMRVMKKDNLGMRLMKKEDPNIGIRMMKKEDSNFGIRMMKKSNDPDEVVADDDEDEGEMVPELPVYDWIMRTMSLRSDPDNTLKSIDNYQPRGMRIMKSNLRM